MSKGRVYPTTGSNLLGHSVPLLLSLLFCIAVPSVGKGEVIWYGDFSTGNFTQWHSRSSKDDVLFPGIPAYGRPVDPDGLYRASGNGDLASIVGTVTDLSKGVEKGPVRTGDYAARFTIKNSQSGIEPDDCGEGGNCRIRRTEVWGHIMHAAYYDAMPYLAERWMSLSVFIPRTHDTSQSGWGPYVFQVKSRNQNRTGNGPTFSIVAGGEYTNESWQIGHRWSDEPMPYSIPWQYRDKWETVNDHAHSAIEDFPDQAVSERALGNLNRGGWTDFVIHFRPDADPKTRNGFLDVWMHFADESGASFGEWVHVLQVRPRRVTRGGMTFDRGIFYNDTGGYSTKIGLYASKSRVWDVSHDTTVIIDNMKIGDENSTFSAMAPNIAPEVGLAKAAPREPELLVVD